MVDGIGTTVYTYSIGGQLQSEGGLFTDDTVTNGYAQHLRTALGLAQPSGEWTNGFVHDAAGRLTNVTSPAGSFGYVYDAVRAAKPALVALPNGSYITNTYDPVARLHTTLLDNSGNTTLDAAKYGYDLAGERTAYTNGAGTYLHYSYDNIGQLKVATGSTSSEDRGYVYDAAWNLNWRTNNGSASQFEVNDLNELTNEPAGWCSYDANGNLLLSAASRYQYAYDCENRLVQWQDTGAAHPLLTDFVYDGLGRLRERLEYIWETSGGGGDGEGGEPDTGGGGGGGSWSLTSETLYIYDGKRVIQERNGSNVPTVSYTRGNDLSGSLEGAGGIGGMLSRSSGYSSGTWATNSYYHADGNGNITCLINSSQSVVASYVYDPFGSTISSSGSMAAANIYRFSSRECHVNSGMYYYLYRFYDPNLQKWINQDPIGEPGFQMLRFRNSRIVGLISKLRRIFESNAYAFVGNRPVFGIDLLGLAPDRGPGSLACIHATEQAEAAADLADEEGTDEAVARAIYLASVAALMCTPPVTPPPWWKRACKAVGTFLEGLAAGGIDALGTLGGLWVFPTQDPTSSGYSGPGSA
jgi:RHS repeat-associated protein